MRRHLISSPAQWPYAMTVGYGAAEIAGVQPGVYGSFVNPPIIFGGQTLEYFITIAYASADAPVRVRFGGATFPSSLLIELEGLAGVWTFSAITNARYAANKLTQSGVADLHAYINASAGQTLGFSVALA